MLTELKRYVGWSVTDEAALRGLHPLIGPRFAAIVDTFYDRILEHEEARTALVGGESQVGHLKVTMTQWLEALFTGPWDDAYYEQRARIGRMHVRIALPQHYMFAAMNVLRRELDNALFEQASLTEAERTTARTALGRILDLELAIMLHTYREDLLSQRARAERLATFGQMAASIGHELRNPLGVIETSLFLLRSRVQNDERANRQVERIGQQVSIASGIITGLLELVRDKPLAKEDVALDQVIENAVALVHKPLGLNLHIEGIAALPHLLGDAGQLRQAFTNLIENAIQAASTDAPEVWVVGTISEGRAQISVEDNGAGVDPSILSRLFEPLITTKSSGTGLGLSLVQRIAERHGGTVEYAPRERGARFVVALPVA